MATGRGNKRLSGAVDVAEPPRQNGGGSKETRMRSHLPSERHGQPKAVVSPTSNARLAEIAVHLGRAAMRTETTGPVQQLFGPEA